MTVIKAPSAKTLMRIKDVDRVTAEKIRTVIKVAGAAEEISGRARDFVTRCWHAPKDYEVKMEALNDLIGGSGVESATAGPNGRVLYVNAGDAYTPTIIRTGPGRYIVATLGDILE